jgi:beta-barrel assembly-enhancing protease
MRILARRRAALAAIAVLLAPPTFAETRYKQGLNLFSEQQDVEIGRRSAAQAERQLRLLRDPSLNAYLNRIVSRLAAVAPGPRYAYQAKAVDTAEVNAFALPGGYMYVNRGLVEAAESEDQLAGVLAHEMAHVALRHGTHQVSRAYVAQAGLGILGGLLGSRDRRSADLVSAVGGLGLNALFLRYSRDAEEEADVVGAQMIARAGYDPEDMARFFDKLAAMSQSQPGRLDRFFSDHPAPAGRATRIRQEARSLGPAEQSAPVGGFEEVRARLRALPPSPDSRTAVAREGFRVPAAAACPAPTRARSSLRRRATAPSSAATASSGSTIRRTGGPSRPARGTGPCSRLAGESSRRPGARRSWCAA